MIVVICGHSLVVKAQEGSEGGYVSGPSVGAWDILARDRGTQRRTPGLPPALNPGNRIPGSGARRGGESGGGYRPVGHRPVGPGQAGHVPVVPYVPTKAYIGRDLVDCSAYPGLAGCGPAIVPGPSGGGTGRAAGGDAGNPGIRGGGEPPIDPRTLHLDDRMPLPEPWIQPGRAITGMRSWLVIGGRKSLHEIAIDEPTGRSVSIDCVATSYLVDWGDGVITGPHDNAGAPYPDGSITHVYEVSQRVQVHIEAEWACHWATTHRFGDGPAHSVGLIRDFPVDEIQAVIDG